MFPPDPTDKERAAAGNGDMLEWMEYEADVNREADWIGCCDPNDKQPLAVMLDPDYKTHLAILELERWFNDRRRDACML